MKWFVIWIAMLAPVLAEGVAASKAEFEKKERELNAVYAALKKDLPAHLFSSLQEDQREWLGYRDGISIWQAREKDPEASAERWESASGITESRVEWLKAWRRIPEDLEKWEGRYSDSRGGELQIVAHDGKIHFTIQVVRGPTYHSGAINGVMRVNGSMAWFETKGEETDRPTWITFLREHDGTGRIRIIGENTGQFHGMRAYFEGQYLRMGEVKGKDRERVIKGELE